MLGLQSLVWKVGKPILLGRKRLPDSNRARSYFFSKSDAIIKKSKKREENWLLKQIYSVKW